jgi:hypothetical protein
MLHRLRSVLVRPGRDRLADIVVVDETFIGGEEPGLRGGRAKGKKVLTGIAVEVREPKGIGRACMAPLADASAASLHAFITDHVEPGLAPRSSPTDDRATAGSRGSATATSHAANAPHAAVATTLASCCRSSTGSRRCRNVGCSAPPGSGQHRPPAQLPRRVRVPVQPAPLTQPWPGLLPGTGTGRRAPARALPRDDRHLPTSRAAAHPPQARGHPPSLDRPAANRPWRTRHRLSSG